MPSLSQWNGSKSRSGRRPLRVDTLLKKDKAGTIFKFGLLGKKPKKKEKAHAQMGEDLVREGVQELPELYGKLESKEAKVHSDQIPGGLADESKPSDFDPKELAMGIKVELEHVNDRTKAQEIAMDHLKEFSDYYTRLKKMESSAEKAKEAARGYKLQGGKDFQGLDIAIENRKGSVRKGTNDDGTEWKTKFKSGKSKLAAEPGHQNLATGSLVNPYSDHHPSQLLEVGVLSPVLGHDLGVVKVAGGVNLDGDLPIEVSKVNVESADGVIQNEVYASGFEPISKQAFPLRDGLDHLSSLGNVLVPPVSSLSKRAHLVPLAAEASLHGGRRAAQSFSNLSSAEAGLVKLNHPRRRDVDPSHEPVVARRYGFIKGAARGYKLQGERKFQGLDVAIENKPGSVRKGVNDDGSKWETRFSSPYGFIRGTKGADGEPVDCYVGPDSGSSTAYVVQQKKDDGSYDEDTVMLGYSSAAAAKKDILRHYDDAKYIGRVVPLAMERLRELVEKRKTHIKLASHSRDMAIGGALSLGALGTVLGARHVVKNLPSADGDADLMRKLKSSSDTPVASVRGVSNAFFRNPVKSTASDDIKRAKGFKRKVLEAGLGDFAKAEEDLKAQGHDPTGPVVFLGDKMDRPGILAHELGHADIHKSRSGRMLQNKGTIIAGNIAPLVGLASGVAAGATGKKWVGRLGAGVSGLSVAPQLSYEGLANLKGYRRLKDSGASDDQLARARKEMLGSYASYLGNAASTAGGYFTGRAVGKMAGVVNPEYSEGHPQDTTIPAKPKRGRLEPPARDEVDPNPSKVEDRRDSQSTITLGPMEAHGGHQDLGKFAETLGNLTRSWEPASADEPAQHTGPADTSTGGSVRGGSPREMSQDFKTTTRPFDQTFTDISVAASQDKEAAAARARSHATKPMGKLDALHKVAQAKIARLQEVYSNAFFDELGKIASANPEFSQLLEKQAISMALPNVMGGLRAAGQGAARAVGRLKPKPLSADAATVKSFRSGRLSTGFGKDLAAGGKQMAWNPQAAGRAAGLGQKDLAALQQMRPTSAGRRITGEVAHGAGHHIDHANPAMLALNPIGVPMGGAIEGLSRGAGKELQRSGSRAVQGAGRVLQKHAPKIGLGGEVVAGGLMHAPGLASVLGGAMAPGAHGVAQHALGSAAQSVHKVAPRAAQGMARAAPHAGRLLQGAGRLMGVA